MHTIKKQIFLLIKVYLFTLLVVFVLLLFYNNFSETVEIIQSLFTTRRGLIFFHVLFSIFYILFLIARYFSRVYKKRGGRIMLKQFTIRFALPILILVFGFKYLIRHNTIEDFNYIWNYNVENTNGAPKNLL